mgnify:CR=1 FL=1
MKQRLASFCSSGWGIWDSDRAGVLVRRAVAVSVWGCRAACSVGLPGELGLGGVVGRERGRWLRGETEMGGRSSHRRVNVRDMPTFTKEEIVHLGDLARIALTDEEITRLQGDLNVIAESINKVQEVATDDVEPTANPIPLEAYLRPDVPETPLTQEEATAGAPVSEAGMFVAPRILGEE